MHNSQPPLRPPAAPARNAPDAAAPATATDAIPLCAEFGLPALDLDALDATTIPAALEADLARRLDILPLATRGARLIVATADPANLAALDDIKLRTGLEPLPVIVAAAPLKAALERYGRAHSHRLLAGLEDERGARADSASAQVDAVDEAPVVKYIDKVLKDAAAIGASDIHFEPYDGFYRVRARIDGVLREVERPPAHLGDRFAARLKVMARLDITERRRPQDGRIQFRPADAGGEMVDLRVSTLPTMHGEKVVLRVLSAWAARMDMDRLGLADDQAERYLAALAQPQGMILVTGPTGSGKTVSLYAGLNHLNAEDRNIATAEDPVEIDVPGINQVQVNARVGLGFDTALRAFLRQDPDVLMVGEIRDAQTAEIAVKAAQTGHLVLSTLHTNSAAETLTRLRNMGIPPYHIASAVTLIIAQRLARLLCSRCRRPAPMPSEALRAEGLAITDIAPAPALFDADPAGCGECDRGYRGRTGIYEVAPLGPRLQRLILDGESSLAIAAALRELGFDDLRRNGLKKALQGLTSLREINRVTTRAAQGAAV